eukprot:g2254.t1
MGDWIRSFDSYSKAIDGASSRTVCGAVVSVLSFVIMFFLFCGEFRAYMEVDMEELAFVDPSAGFGQHVHLDFDISFSKLSCDGVHIDTEEKAGKSAVDVSDGVRFEDLKPSGCRVFGTLKLQKVSGKFQIVAGKGIKKRMGGSDKVVYEISMEDLKKFDPTHRVDKFSFGPRFPGMPSSQLEDFASAEEDGGGLRQYKYS